MILLIFEADFTELRTKTWVVHCQPEKELERFEERDQLGTDPVRENYAAQWGLQQKQQLAAQRIDSSSDNKHRKSK